MTEKHAIYMREWRKRNPEKAADAGRRFRSRHPDKRKATVNAWRKNNPQKMSAMRKRARLKRDYGITPEQQADMLVSQGSKCAICYADEPGTKRGWHTDHCHSTAKVRGILCHHCNAMLGGARDNPVILQAAIAYLEGVKP